MDLKRMLIILLSIINVILLVLIIIFVVLPEDTLYLSVPDFGIIGYTTFLDGENNGKYIASSTDGFVVVGSDTQFISLSRVGTDFKQHEVITGDFSNGIFSDTIDVYTFNGNENVNVYTESNGVLTFNETLTKDDHYFGYSVCFSEIDMFIGFAHDNEGSGGGISVYNRNTLEQNSTIQPDDTVGFDNFGQTSIFNNNQLLVGSPNTNNNVGGLYVFKDDNGWNQKQKILIEDLPVGASFGSSMSISDNGLFCVVGIPNDTYHITNLIDLIRLAGSAVTLTRDKITDDWEIQDRFYSEEPTLAGHFGTSVCILENNLFFIGAPGENKVYMYQKSSNKSEYRYTNIVMEGDDGFGLASSKTSNDELYITSHESLYLIGLT
jgi:hypothetical protein